MNNYSQLPIVILAGGKATRMGGRNKAFIEIKNQSMISKILERISGFTSNIAINANENIADFKIYPYEILEDRFEGHLGPLSGILTAIEWACDKGENWVLTVPCDTPFIPRDLISKMCARIITNQNKYDIISVKSNDRSHPVIAVWKTDLRDKLIQSITEGMRKIDIFTSLFKIDFINYQFNNNQIDPFLNINSPYDIFFAYQKLGYIPPVLGLAGWSRSGKTTLSEKLVDHFSKNNIKTAYIKRAHHKIELDYPEKDTYRIRKVGASPVIISSKNRFGIIYDNNKEDEKSIYELMTFFYNPLFSSCKLIIIEGFKNEIFPKIEVYRKNLNKSLLYENDDNIIAVVSEKNLKFRIPFFNINDVSKISNFIIKRFNLRDKKNA